MGVVFNCRKESASQKSMKSNNGQLSKNKVVGILFPQTSLLFLDSGAAPPSPCSTSALCPRRRPSGRFVSSSDKSSPAGGVGEFLEL